MKGKKGAMILMEKHKDARPLDTLQTISTIYHNIGVLPVERWINSVPGLYSVRVEVDGTNAGTNGKGTSHSFALASAYAELMERLQNQILYDVTSPEMQAYRGFYWAPDEIAVSRTGIKDVAKAMELYLPPISTEHGPLADSTAEKLREWFPHLAREDEYDILASIRQEKYMGDPDEYILVPLYSVRKDKLVYIPAQLIRYVYGSNGMCAGNTPAEAMLQGICEVMERHVNRRILFDGIIPPDVPDDYLQQYPALHDVIKKIEDSGRYRVLVKDCSLGLGYPVVGLILLDTQKQRYYAKFGSHPSFGIALERCLTEVFQGVDINTSLFSRMVPVDLRDTDTSQAANIINIMRVGIGRYPAGFLAGRAHYPFKPFADVGSLSNQDMLEGLAGLLLSQGYDILARDVSFLGFPSYHLFVPGMSEMYGYNATILSNRSTYREVVRIVRNLKAATDEELQKVVDYILQRRKYILEAENLGSLLCLNAAADFPLAEVDSYLFIALAYVRMGDYEKAARAMEVFRRRRKHQPGDDRAMYYGCLREFIAGRAQGLDGREIVSVLELFYPRELVQRVGDLLAEPENVFKDFVTLDCWECGKCAHVGSCAYPRVRDLHMALKDRYAAANINQADLAAVFGRVTTQFGGLGDSDRGLAG